MDDILFTDYPTQLINKGLFSHSRQVSVISESVYLVTDVSVSSFNLGTTDSGSSKCVGSLAAQDLGLGGGVWLLGDAYVLSSFSAPLC